MTAHEATTGAVTAARRGTGIPSALIRLALPAIGSGSSSRATTTAPCDGRSSARRLRSPTASRASVRSTPRAGGPTRPGYGSCSKSRVRSFPHPLARGSAGDRKAELRRPLVASRTDASTAASRCAGDHRRVKRHTGTPYNWVRGAEERRHVRRMISFFARYTFGDRPLVVLNAFSHGRLGDRHDHRDRARGRTAWSRRRGRRSTRSSARCASSAPAIDTSSWATRHSSSCCSTRVRRRATRGPITRCTRCSAGRQLGGAARLPPPPLPERVLWLRSDGRRDRAGGGDAGLHRSQEAGRRPPGGR